MRSVLQLGVLPLAALAAAALGATFGGCTITTNDSTLDGGYTDTGTLPDDTYGKERPFADGHDESAWAQNRRAHLVVK